MKTGGLLIVEDEPLLGAEISRHFRKGEWIVEWATSLEQAQKLMLKESFDPLVVLSDMNLPDGNALDLMEEVRPKQAYAEWIFLTGYGSALSRKRCRGCTLTYLLPRAAVDWRMSAPRSPALACALPCRCC